MPMETRTTGAADHSALRSSRFSVIHNPAGLHSICLRVLLSYASSHRPSEMETGLFDKGTNPILRFSQRGKQSHSELDMCVSVLFPVINYH